jgi:transcriptional antiterminator NusG
MAEEESFYIAARVTGNKERKVLEMLDVLQDRPSSLKAVIYSPKIKGYLILEVTNMTEVYYYLRQKIRYFKGFMNQQITEDDVRALLEEKKEEVEFRVGELVRITSGPFKGEMATIKSIDKDKKELSVSFIQSSVPIQIVVKMSDVMKVEEQNENRA